MLDAFISLLESLAQSAFIWNGDIVINVSGGAVDWIGLLSVLVLLLLAFRKR